MEYNVNKIDEANAVVTTKIAQEKIDAQLNKLLKQAAKTTEIQGFRKGKAPVSVIKQRYGQKLQQDAESEAVREVFTAALGELKITNEDLIGEPGIAKFDKQEDGSIDVEVKLSMRPQVDLGDYKALLPEVKTKRVTAKEIDEKINELGSQNTPLVKLKRKRMAREGDFAVIDFEGFKDGVAFEGGKAEKHTLELGSGQFIPGFEDQIIGMKYEEEKEINVTFPEKYNVADLAGADVVFKVKLHELQEKGEPTVDDAFAQQMLGQEDATVDTLKEKVKEQISAEKMNQYYAEELKPAYIEALVKAKDFAIPGSILEQEVNQILNNQIRTMSEDEIKGLQEDATKVEKMREEAKPEATNNVKATFIVDALAKAENVEVSDQEVTQAIYYEAMMTGQDGVGALKKYEEMGYLPAIKMSMMEQKVISQLLDEKAGK
jgi:trigger factor